ncbi:MAG: hypothetical protein UY48_C0003G0047 [Candidatus Gottesmanbacteria bacterium GW2011_GWB1_49_7]|uniref:Uncharacterized protein n=1 Tax=Candidatus Gottesmanbacteria bacterium GW2011_GWB1_49_7 TaxID=1618448 RepID=A0A0G1W3T1_9BACT|nr:MAG: hypothetical protein UY48_C0003G0047 [Candidatus Gottesmanbacteria bacterium GW2011_GWB1_49_7]
MKNYCHYTNFGVSMRPWEADNDGFLMTREDFESLPKSSWTASEAWVFDQNERIDA